MPPLGAPIIVKLNSPIGGIVRSIDRENQPPGTAVDGENVLPYDSLGRKRIAQRYGTTILYYPGDPDIGHASFIQGLWPVGFVLAPGAAIVSPPLVISIIDYPTIFSTSTGGTVTGGGSAFIDWNPPPPTPSDPSTSLGISFTMEMDAPSTGYGGAFGSLGTFVITYTFQLSSTGGGQDANVSGSLGLWAMEGGFGPSTLGGFSFADPGSGIGLWALTGQAGGVNLLLDSNTFVAGGAFGSPTSGSLAVTAQFVICSTAYKQTMSANTVLDTPVVLPITNFTGIGEISIGATGYARSNYYSTSVT